MGPPTCTRVGRPTCRPVGPPQKSTAASQFRTLQPLSGWRGTCQTHADSGQVFGEMGIPEPWVWVLAREC